MSVAQRSSRPAVVAISSHVARGSVGNRAIVFALESLGFPVWSVPTVTLPWHPGHGPAPRIVPDGATFAVGSHDNKIYLYDARGGRFELRAKCTKHNSYITHLDFSSDSSTIVSNCGAYELLFCTLPPVFA